MKSLLEEAARCGISRAELAMMIGCSGLHTEMEEEEFTLEEGTEAFARATLALRAICFLSVLLGDDRDSIRAWLCSHSVALDHAPISLMASKDGLSRVVFYLESRSGAK